MSLEIWKERVSIEYKKLLALAVAKHATNVQKEWAKNCANLQNEIEQQNEEKARGPKWPTSKTAKIRYLKPCATIPKGNKWVLVKTNLKCPKSDENQTYNIPYFNDAEAKGIRAEKRAQQTPASIIQDDLILELVENLKAKYFPGKKENLFYLNKNWIFDAISQQILHGEPSQLLIDKYNQIFKPKLNSNDACNSFDGATEYLCRRCYKYACNLHLVDGVDATADQLARKESNDSEITQSAIEPCGVDCFLNIKVASVGNKSDDSQTNKTEVNNHEWCPDDVELYRKLRNIFRDNYCVIAQSMLTKSCRQVFELSKIDKCQDLAKLETRIPVVKKISRSKKHRFLYRTHMKTNATKKLSPYTPCNHAENRPCDDNCSCIKTNNFCEKFCKCNKNICLNRFIGCTCKLFCDTKRCLCYSSGRECDPDLCKACGAGEFDESKSQCRNTNIQRGRLKKLLLASSDVAGWGIFLKDGAKKNEFISEYCGEIITQAEANRRGRFYDKAKSSFLFNLNEEFVIDATRIGSEVRFANHSLNPNCYVKVLMILGDHRIGVFAKRDISPGEELFFDYGYRPEQCEKFLTK